MGYKVLEDNHKEKEILKMESICPCCGAEHSIVTRLQYKKLWFTVKQNKYLCGDCHSIWLGNAYDNNYNKVNKGVEILCKVR